MRTWCSPALPKTPTTRRRPASVPSVHWAAKNSDGSSRSGPRARSCAVPRKRKPSTMLATTSSTKVIGTRSPTGRAFAQPRLGWLPVDRHPGADCRAARAPHRYGVGWGCAELGQLRGRAGLLDQRCPAPDGAGWPAPPVRPSSRTLVGTRVQACGTPGDALAGHRHDAHTTAMVGTLPSGALPRAWQQARFDDFRLDITTLIDFPSSCAAAL